MGADQRRERLPARPAGSGDSAVSPCSREDGAVGVRVGDCVDGAGGRVGMSLRKGYRTTVLVHAAPCKRTRLGWGRGG